MRLPETREELLAGHLWRIRRGFPSERGGWSPVDEEAAKGIIADPQAHIDALVEARVLAPTDRVNSSGPYVGWPAEYEVVHPHVHEWRVVGPTKADSAGTVLIACDLGPSPCGTRLWVLNRLPIEVPE